MTHCLVPIWYGVNMKCPFQLMRWSLGPWGGGVVLFGEVLEMLRGGTLLRKYVTGREYLGVTSLWPFLLQ